MKSVRMIVTVRNNLLMKRREQLGLSMNKLAKKIGMRATSYGRLEGLKKSPLKKNGEWTADAKCIARFHRVSEEELFPAALEEIEKTRVERELEASEMFLLHNGQKTQLEYSPDIAFDQMNLSEVSKEVLATLTPREQTVLMLRFGLFGEEEHSLAKVGEIIRVCNDRVRQIEAKALRKLRHPSRAKLLHPFVHDK